MLRKIRIVVLTFGVAALTWSLDAVADDQIVDDFELHLGIVPADHLIAHPSVIPAGHPVVAGKDSYHVLVAVFDRSTGMRITDAAISARVAPLGMGGRHKPMVAIEIGGQLTYCNFFELEPRTDYTIDLEITRGGATRTSTARFLRRIEAPL